MAKMVKIRRVYTYESQMPAKHYYPDMTDEEIIEYEQDEENIHRGMEVEEAELTENEVTIEGED